MYLILSAFSVFVCGATTPGCLVDAGGAVGKSEIKLYVHVCSNINLSG